MFNTPRRGGSIVASTLLSSSSHDAFADPLASAPGGFGEVDPWSGIPSPAQPATPRGSNGPESANGSVERSALDALIDDPPEAYLSLFRQLEPSIAGDVSVSAVQRMLTTSRLPASTVETIIHLTARDKVSLSRSDVVRIFALVALAQSNPEADLTLSSLTATLPNLSPPQLGSSSSLTPSRPYAPPHMPSSFSSPWEAPQSIVPHAAVPPTNGTGGFSGDDTRGANGGGFPEADAQRGYWQRLENIEVELIPEKEGWFLQKYRLVSDKRAEPLMRRYSDFVWLLDTLTKRYPFRLLPSIPPKRIGPDASFLEQRRKGLRRFINAIVNHPVMRDDGALNVFLTEANFEAWRKRVKVSTEEESASKKLNPAQEMAIPADLDEKLNVLKTRLPSLISSYQKLVMLTERTLARLQASSSDAARLAVSLQTVAEDMPAACHRCVPGGKCCDLCQGTGRGLEAVGEAWSGLGEQKLQDSQTLVTAIEALKTQRDLYTSFRDLFARHERLSRDSVDALRKKVETRQHKIEALRSAQKPGWEVEVDKLVSGIDQDNATITTLLARRVFIRACMWHELAVVLHSRQAAHATLSWRAWVAGERDAAKTETGVWERLGDDLESMPLE